MCLIKIYSFASCFAEFRRFNFFSFSDITWSSKSSYFNLMLLNYSILAEKFKEWMSSKVELVFGKMSKRAPLNFVKPYQCSICLNSSCLIAMNIQVLKVNICKCEEMFQIQKLCIIDNLIFLFSTMMSTSCIKRIIWLLQWWSSC